MFVKRRVEDKRLVTVIVNVQTNTATPSLIHMFGAL